jgi:hypothetical protein
MMIDAEICRKCKVSATRELASKCSTEKMAVIWYDECMVRYSNESIFSTVALRPLHSLWNPQYIAGQDGRFNQLLNKTITQLASEASNFPIGVKKYGTKEVDLDFTQFQNLYNLVQSTPDLSSADCNSCLQAAINFLL